MPGVGVGGGALPATAPLRLPLKDAIAPSGDALAKATRLRRLEFEEAGDFQAELVAGLKTKYLVLRAEPLAAPPPPAPALGKGEQDGNNNLPAPKRTLFPLSSVKHGWRHGWKVGAGMQNFGNTCYLNSTLQALFHVSAFSNWLISENHAENCTQTGGCIICAMRKTLIDTQSSEIPIKPWQVFSKLRLICRHLTPGRQEDAHEFLRYLVEAMEKAYLSQFDGIVSKLDQYSKETTPLNQILGGYLRSLVRCLACGHVSTTFQHFQDLLVDARKASTIDEALETFFSRERLEDLGYKCEFCNKKVSATKQFFIERPPMVLCIALKRFSMTGGKLTKHIQFKPRLSLGKYMFNSNNLVQLGYRLVSIVTHLGQSQNCGHYTAAGVGPADNFYQFDDSCVREISLSQVLSTNAYILFYEYSSSSISTNRNLQNTILSKELNENIPGFIGPVMPKNIKSNEDSLNRSNSSCSIDNFVNNENDKSFNGIKLKIPLSSSNKLSENNSNGSTSKEKQLSQTSNVSHTLTSPTKSNGISKPNINYNKHIFHIGSNINNNSNTMVTDKNCNSVVKNSSSSNANISFSTVKSVCDKRNSISGSIHPNSEKSEDSLCENKSSNSICKILSGTSKMNDCKSNSSEIKTYSTQNKISSNHSIGESNLNKLKMKLNSSSNGSTSVSSSVPCDSELSKENQSEFNSDKYSCTKLEKPYKLVIPPVTPTKATSLGWRVSHEEPENRESPKHQKTITEKTEISHDTRETFFDVQEKNSEERRGKEVVSHLQRLSHSGFGNSISTWSGTHSRLNRQVYEDKKSELKRAAEADDEMDRGRIKKLKFHNYNKYHNGRSSYNTFQETQNNINKWGYMNWKFHNNRNFKHKPRNRFNPHYSRHHSNSQYRHHYRNQ